MDETRRGLIGRAVLPFIALTSKSGIEQIFHDNYYQELSR
ncbi:hypothetical protein AGRO_4383 [Agrobacterium sp. ATCC 31749]|nr:hypothetical protein AGRO_4383 [Agrobacterium sp. ATCC 31749]